MHYPMKKNLTRLLGIVFLLFVYLSMPPIALADSDDDQAQSEQALQKLKIKIKHIRDELDEVRSLHDKVRKELRETEVNIGKRVNNLYQLKRKLRHQHKRLAELQRQRDDLNKDLSVQRELLSQQVRTSYTIGKQEYLKLLLNQEDPAAMGRVLTYYEYFNQARSEKIETLTKTLVKLEQVKKDIRQETTTLQKLKQEQTGEKDKLELNYKERALVIAKLSQEIQSKDSALKQLLENEKQLKRVLNVITESMPEITSEDGKLVAFSQLKGKLIWPAQGKVDALFGRSRNRFNVKWSGVIIKAPQGHNVRAISHGRVAYADWLRGYGLLIIIDHGDGYMSLYGHNESLKKETGDWVSSGDIIGSVGDSGGQIKTGLYFEIRHNGTPTNPKIWCRKSQRG